MTMKFYSLASTGRIDMLFGRKRANDRQWGPMIVLGSNARNGSDVNLAPSLTPGDRFSLAVRDISADLNNFHLLHYRRVDGFLVTAKNSGTHWLKYMLSHALANELGLPPPLHASGPTANDFVGHPKWPRKYAQAPKIGSSHNLPSSILARGPIFRALRLPPNCGSCS